MVKSKKIISMVLAFALILTSVFVGGVSVTAASLDDLYLTVNNYDNLPEGVEFSTVDYAGYNATNVVVNGSPEMEDASSIRHFSAWAVWVDKLPSELGSGNALHFTGAGNAARDNIYQTIARIYKSDSAAANHFRPVANKTYEVKLRYFVAKTPNKELELQLRQAQWSQCSFQNPNDDDGIWMEPVVITTISESTTGWNEAVAYFTAPATPYYFNLCLAAQGGGASNVDVWVDDLTVGECVKTTVHNYTPDTNKAIPVSKITTIADLQPADVEGYRFGGVFSDEACQNRLPADALAGGYADLYFNWLPITINDFYCGFEDYSQPIKNISYSSDVSEIVAEGAYVGKFAMKNTLGEKGIAAFEIKNANTFNVAKDGNYTITLSYKSDKAVEIYAGLGKLGNVPATAKAIVGTAASASSEWKTVTLSVNADKGTAENYVLALMLYAENGATVYVDDILVSGVLNSYVNPTLNTGFSSDYYPGLALFEGVELPKIWGGQNDLSAPKDTNNDGVYEIENGAELAYAIKNGGGADAKYILTKDIYLNNTNAIDWKTGAVLVDGYTPNTWFNQGTSFQGSIDGDGHIIYGLYRKDNPSSMTSYPGYGTALVPKLPDNGTVSFKNLAVDYAFINVECGAAAFVGTTQSTSQGATSITVDGCYVGENVQLNGGDAGAFVGYTGGSGCNITLNNSYSLAATSGVKNRGLVAVCYQATLLVKNCFNANGPVTSYTNVNWTGNYTIKNTYQTEVNGTDKYYYPTNFETISADNMKGLDVFSSGKMETLNASNAYVATEGFPKLAFFEGIELPEYWLGTADLSAPKDTNDDGVLEIGSGAELAYAISNGGGAGVKYILTKDIYLNDPAKFNWETGEVNSGETVNSWSYYNKPFQGSIDGDGHTIYGLYYKDSSALSWAIQGAGLIPRVDFGTTCELKNLAIDKSYIYGHAGASAFVGCGGTGNSYTDNRAEIIIDSCVVGEEVTVKGTSAGAFRGATRGANTTITNSYSLGTVVGSDYGLVAGESWESTVIMTNVFNANGPLGSAAGGTFTNCYQTVAGAYAANVIDADAMQGKDVFDNASKMPNLNADNKFTATDSFPMPSVFVKAASEDGSAEGDKEETEITIWDGSVAEGFATGEGTATNPYVITNGAELALAISQGGADETYYNKHFVLEKDIYLNDISKINWITGAVASGYKANSWLKHEKFAGTIDGNGHIVYGLYYKDTAGKYTSYAWGMGLVPYVVDSDTVSISNLGIDNCFIYYECGAAAFVGTVNGSAKAYINGCFVGGNVTIDGADAGAFRGYTQSGTTSIISSYSLATVKGGVRTNGLVGNMSGSLTVSHCYNAKGIIPKGTVTNSYQSEGTDSEGIYTISAENMKGDDVLTNKDKMPLLAFASAFVPAYLDFAEHDYYIYLPTGTILAEDYEPTFFDSFLVGTTAEKVMNGNTMKQGAFIRFAKEPSANNIVVPAHLADFIRQGGYEAVSSDSILDSYYGIETEVLSKQISKSSKDTLNYIFITDIHFMNYDLSWDKSGNVLLEQIRLITEWANNDENIDFIVVGGDSVQGFWDTKAGWKDAITEVFKPFRESEKPVFVTIGNHDDNAYATWNVNYSEKIISDLDWKNYVLDPISPADIVRPEGDPNAKNYYYDFEKNGKTTRLFFLDAIDYYQEYDENGDVTALEIRKSLGYTEESAEDYTKYNNGRSYFGYSASQVKWLAESLAETDDFDDVMVFSHMGTDSSTSTAEFGAEVADVMAAYNNKTAYKNEALEIDVEYNDGGRILSYQFGHIHKELSIYNTLADLWQIASSTARADQGSRTLGNADEACFDLMSVAPGVIRKYNIGAGEDRNFYSENNVRYGDLTLDNVVDIRDLVKLATTKAGTSAAADVNRDNLIAIASDTEALRKLILGK